MSDMKFVGVDFGKEDETVLYLIGKMREPSCFKGKISTSQVDADFRSFADRLHKAYSSEILKLEKERDNWRKQALEEGAVNNVKCNNAAMFESYREMVEYWSSHYGEIKKPLMVWAFEKD